MAGVTYMTGGLGGGGHAGPAGLTVGAGTVAVGSNPPPPPAGPPRLPISFRPTEYPPPPPTPLAEAPTGRRGLLGGVYRFYSGSGWVHL